MAKRRRAAPQDVSDQEEARAPRGRGRVPNEPDGRVQPRAPAGAVQRASVMEPRFGGGELTLGVEEEYMLLDDESFALTSAIERVLERVRGVGLAPVDVRGSLRGGRLDAAAPDEGAHHKLVVVARKEVTG
jgi:hypothetical protein